MGSRIFTQLYMIQGKVQLVKCLDIFYHLLMYCCKENLIDKLKSSSAGRWLGILE